MLARSCHEAPGTALTIRAARCYPGATNTVRARAFLVALALVVLVPAGGHAAGVAVAFDLSSPATSPFPSDVFTVPDPSQLTGVRVSLPRPDCAARPSDCADIDVINTLDGFNLQPRLRIPFTGAIDPATATSATIFLVRLGPHGRGSAVGINQVVWDPATTTIFAESDALLAQRTRWALIVTDGVRDAAGDPVEAGAFARFRHVDAGPAPGHALASYRQDVLDALRAAGVSPARVVGASVFTTQSATAVLEKIRDRLKQMTPAPASFLLGAGGERTVFPLTDIASVQLTRQITTGPGFVLGFMPTAALAIVPGVGHLAFGRFASPDWQNAQQLIPPIGTRTGGPAVQGTRQIHFTLVLPEGTPPPRGWPVAIFGHGLGDSKDNSPLAVAAVMAARGLATVAINIMGHGGGALGTLTVFRTGGLPPVALPAGGRGIDQDGDGAIDATEGLATPAGPLGIVGSRDGLRQTVADLMQLVRVIQVGVDVDGNGVPDLDRRRIYYLGQSLGGSYGTALLAVEPDVRAGVQSAPGGPTVEVSRLSPLFRAQVGTALAARVPSLINLGGHAFDENMPLRDEAPRVNAVPGALAIQEVLEHTEWVSQSGNPVAYAPHLRAQPLDGVDARRVIVQLSRGDQAVPNPTSTAILRAGDLADRATYFRNDLVVPARPGAPRNGHAFLTNLANPAVADLALAAQLQVATFFQTEGAVVIDPDGPGPFFEVPIGGPLPETPGFIP
jgi:hypothetical protein